LYFLFSPAFLAGLVSLALVLFFGFAFLFTFWFYSLITTRRGGRSFFTCPKK